MKNQQLKIFGKSNLFYILVIFFHSILNFLYIDHLYETKIDLLDPGSRQFYCNRDRIPRSKDAPEIDWNERGPPIQNLLTGIQLQNDDKQVFQSCNDPAIK